MPPKLVYYVRVWGRNARPTQDMGMSPQENTMNYATIKYCDIANGEGVRTSLFVSGCRRHCPNCFNAVAWDFGFGAPFTKEVRNEILESLAPGYINGLSLLGGEPFEPENQPGLLELSRRIRAAYPEKSIWSFSGYLFDRDILAQKLGPGETTRELLSYLDVLVDGPFVASLKNLNLRFRGSSNQRLIDIPATLASGRIVLWDDGYQRGGHYDAKGTR